MVVFPNAKINLGLRIVRKRADNYHDLETIFYPLAFADVLEIIPKTDDSFSLTTTGISITIDPVQNLCSKAYALLKKDFPKLNGVEMHLHKAIPSGAGLGGGSADAAFTLKLLNEYFTLGMDENMLLNYALQLGSDCPFFIINKPSLATSRGEILTPVTIDLSAYHFVLVNPGIHISTAAAFAQITPTVPDETLTDVIRQPVTEWKDKLVNDFEPGVFTQYPDIKKIKDELYAAGAIYASMTGTGSTVYGMFERGTNPELQLPAAYLVKRET